MIFSDVDLNVTVIRWALYRTTYTLSVFNGSINVRFYLYKIYNLTAPWGVFPEANKLLNTHQSTFNFVKQYHVIIT